MKDQVQRAGTCAPSLPEPQSMSVEQEQLLDQMANVIRVIGDSLDREPRFNELVSISKCLFGMREYNYVIIIVSF